MIDSYLPSAFMDEKYDLGVWEQVVAVLDLAGRTVPLVFETESGSCLAQYHWITFQLARPQGMPETILEIPLDIWVLITQNLSLQAILSMRGTCKSLHDTMNERAILERALRKLLRTIPVPHILHNIPSKSAEDVLQTLLKITHLDREKAFTPKRIYQYPHSHVLKAQFLPGGNLIVLLLSHGILHITRTHNFHIPESKVYPPSRNWGQDQYKLYISMSAQYGPLVMLRRHRDPQSNYRTELSLHAVNAKLEQPALILLRKVRIPHGIRTCCAHGNLIAYAWTAHRVFVTIRDQYCPPDEEEMSVVMTLGISDHITYRDVYRISILSPRLLLLSNSAILHLYEIPERKPISENNEVPVSPIWSFRFPLLPYSPTYVRDRMTISPIIWSGLHGQHIGFVTILNQNRFAVLSPSHISDKCHVRTGSLGSQFQPFFPAVGYSRVIWTTDPSKSGAHAQTSLHAATYFKPSLGYEGLLRGLKKNTLEPQVQSLKLVPEDTSLRVQDISWDEESGRVCVLYHSFDTNGILTIDSL